MLARDSTTPRRRFFFQPPLRTLENYKMCSGKGSAVGAEIAAVVFLVLSAFLSIGAMAGSYKVLSVPCVETTTTFYALAYDESVGGQKSRTTYADYKCDSSNIFLAPCALYKNAANNGGPAVRPPLCLLGRRNICLRP